MNTSSSPHEGAVKGLVILTVCSVSVAMPLAFSGPAVALQAISHELGGTPIALNWVTNAFMLALGSFLMVAGSLADHYGRKRMFVIGAGAFSLSSLSMIIADNILYFDLLRAVQGIAAAMTFSAGMAVLAQEFHGENRVRVFSMVGTSFGLGLAFGPVLSGLLTTTFGWQSIFVLVALMTALAFLLGTLILRESRNPHARQLDWPGAISFTTSLSMLTYGMLLVPENGLQDMTVIFLLIGAILVMAIFVWLEGRAKQPMLDLSLFRYPRFIGAQLLAAAPAYAFVVLLIILPFRFVGIENMTPSAAGAMMMALSSPLVVIPLMAGIFARWFSLATICGVGLVICAIGLIWLGRIEVGGSLVIPMLIIGIGISLPWGVMDGIAVSVVPKERAGMAAGIFNTTRVAGEGVALAMVSAILSGLVASHFAGEGSGVIIASQRLVSGDLETASLALPRLGHDALVAAYGTAFSTLTLILAAITILTAIVVFLFLKHDHTLVPDLTENVALKPSQNPHCV